MPAYDMDSVRDDFLLRETPRLVPIAHPEQVRSLVRLREGVCALRGRGVECFSDVATPGRASVLALEDVEQIMATDEDVCARHRDGHVTCARPGTHQVVDARMTGVIALSGDDASVCALSPTMRRAACFGTELDFESDDDVEGVLDTSIAPPGAAWVEGVAEIAGRCRRVGRRVSCMDGDAVVDIAGGYDEIASGGRGFVCGRDGGEVRCWGYDDTPAHMAMSGREHPDNPFAPASYAAARFSPIPVPGLHDATAISLREDNGCALRATGVVACFIAAGASGLGSVPAFFSLQMRPVVLPTTSR